MINEKRTDDELFQLCKVKPTDYAPPVEIDGNGDVENSRKLGKNPPENSMRFSNPNIEAADKL